MTQPTKQYAVEILTSTDKKNWFPVNMIVNGTDQYDARMLATNKFLDDFEKVNEKKFVGYIETSANPIKG